MRTLSLIMNGLKNVEIRRNTPHSQYSTAGRALVFWHKNGTYVVARIRAINRFSTIKSAVKFADRPNKINMATAGICVESVYGKFPPKPRGGYMAITFSISVHTKIDTRINHEANSIISMYKVNNGMTRWVHMTWDLMTKTMYPTDKTTHSDVHPLLYKNPRLIIRARLNCGTVEYSLSKPCKCCTEKLRKIGCYVCWTTNNEDVSPLIHSSTLSDGKPSAAYIKK